MNSYMENLSVESCTRSLAHANMKCSIGKKLSIYITPPCATVLKTLPLAWHIVSHITLKVDLVWPKCSRSIYHKEMYTTNMTFAAPSLQLRSNTFFHSYEFEWQKASFKQVFEIILSNRNFLLKRRSPFVLCHNGWHFKYWRCKNDSLYDSVDVFAFLYANYSTRCILAIL